MRWVWASLSAFLRIARWTAFSSPPCCTFCNISRIYTHTYTQRHTRAEAQTHTLHSLRVSLNMSKCVYVHFCCSYSSEWFLHLQILLMGVHTFFLQVSLFKCLFLSWIFSYICHVYVYGQLVKERTTLKTAENKN